MGRIKLRNTAVLLLLAIGLTACGGGNAGNAGNNTQANQTETNAPAENKESESAEPVTIRVSYWAGTQLTIDAHDNVVKLFEQAHPNIKVQSEYAPGAEYTDKILVQAASKDLADVVRVDYSQIQNYVSKGLLQPLDSFVADKTIDLEGINPLHIDVGKVDDKLYGVNIGNNALVLFYDPEKLKEAGVTPPSADGYSWEQYEQDLQAVKDKLGIYGDTHFGQSQFEIWLRQHDAKLYNDAQNGLGYDDDQLFTAFFETQLRLQKKGLLTPVAVESEIKALEDGPFPKGNSAFGGWGYWSGSHSAVVEKQLNKVVGFSLFPGSGKGAYIKPSFFHGIASNSKHPKEAAQFIEFYTNNIEAAKSLDGYFGFPYNPKVLAGVEAEFTDTQKRVRDYLELVEAQGNPIDPAAPSAGSEVSTSFKNIASEIFYEKLTPSDGAKRFREEANKALNK
ncbi:ABC transporter substrate-binding protein [Paenibacillus sinopodophylli]|uniref:ABC transporter substrate-binding protein n=1 Tax=Paenibacillus sinopodophylli TaxID=1837342 RepID=UPI00110CDB0A|nr:extracellular solute-binding protein [Paenibacillus sinopodophylli]